MCRGSTASNPSQHSQYHTEYGSASGFSNAPDPSPVVPPILSFPYLQHPSQGTAIEDALARAQAEAAMWRASFEKGQKLALRNYAANDGEASRLEGTAPTSMATALSDASFAQQSLGSDQAVSPNHRIRTLADPWLASLGGGARGLAQSRTNKQEQTRTTPFDVDLDLSNVYDDLDSFKDLNALALPTGSAPLETTAFSPPTIKNEYMQRSIGAFYQTDNSPTFWQGGRYSQGFAYPQHLKSYGGVSSPGPGWSSATPLVMDPPVYSTSIADVAEMLEAPASPVGTSAPSQEHAKVFEGNDPQLQFVGKQEMGVLQHPGVTQARRMRQLLPRSQQKSSSACSPSRASGLECVEARGRSGGQATPKSEAYELPAPSSGGAARQCIAPGCTRRPSYGVVFGTDEKDKGGARWCRTHAAEAMEDMRNPRCSVVGPEGMACRAQPSFGYKGDKRPLRCRAHAEDGMENVRMARCHQEGCKRQPLYGEPGVDRKATHCRNHAVPGMRDLRGAMCQGAEGTCGKRPSYGFRGDPRPTRCGTHKELGMEDLISARCNFGDCRTVASYGVQAFGSHVIRRTRCKAHRTAEMTCGTKGPACMNPGGCETRPSYGWPDKCDDEAALRPERCKKHLLPGMEYMGSAARAKRRRAMAEEAIATPLISLSARQNTAAVATRPLYIPPTGRPRPVRSCAAAVAPIIRPEEDGEWYDTDRFRARGQEGQRNWFPEGHMQVDSKLESARLAEVRAARARTLTDNREVQARAERSRTLKELENLGDMKALQELREIEDQANDQLWGSNGPTSAELEGMLFFDNELFVQP